MARQRVPVIQITHNGAVEVEFESITIASEATNSQTSHICECCNGKRTSHKGNEWRYKYGKSDKTMGKTENS